MKTTEVATTELKFSSLNELADFICQRFSLSERSKIVELIQPNEEDDCEEPTKEQLISEIKEAVREVNLIKKDILRSRPLKGLLDEL
jgi:hypothetical protein